MKDDVKFELSNKMNAINASAGSLTCMLTVWSSSQIKEIGESHHHLATWAVQLGEWVDALGEEGEVRDAWHQIWTLR